MVDAAAFQSAGRGVGARFRMERRGEEREHRVANQNGEERGCRGEFGGGA